VLRHHLEHLVQAGAIRSLRDGNRITFYSSSDWKVHAPAAGDPALALIHLVQMAPGSTHKDLSQAIGMKRTALDYHVARLIATGAITVRKEGKERKYWCATSPREAGSAVGGAVVILRPDSVPIRNQVPAESLVALGAPVVAAVDGPMPGPIGKAPTAINSWP
jgi:DNA-binding transcriptional ArsR family regulator